MTFGTLPYSNPLTGPIAVEGARPGVFESRLVVASVIREFARGRYRRAALSGQDLPDRAAVVDLQPLAPGHIEPTRIEPQQVQ